MVFFVATVYIYCSFSRMLAYAGRCVLDYVKLYTMEFWRLLALYISSNTLSSVYWAIPFGQDEVNTMLNQAKEVLSWYDNMRNPVPTWYFKGYYLQYIDGIPFKLKSTFDFSFMKEYGTVFKVYDDQDSGNICFGTEKGGQRYREAG